MNPRRIILPGGAGFIGQHLARHLADLDYDITILTRTPRPDAPRIRHLRWDGQTPDPWTAALDGAHAVINLAGRSVNCRYTAKHKQEIYDSRLLPTKLLGDAIDACKSPPPVWFNASSATIYRDASDDRAMDETTGEIGHDFSMDVCKKWEAALDAAPTPHTRKVALRAAMVFGPGKGGVFAAFHLLTRLGLAGTLGHGRQWMSWIHVQDFCRAVQFLLDRPDLAGPVNLTAPSPVRNREFMQTFRDAAHRSIGLPATKWMLEIGAFFLRTETELLLKSRRVLPTRLSSAGFTFDFPDLKPALDDLESQ